MGRCLSRLPEVNIPLYPYRPLRKAFFDASHPCDLVRLRKPATWMLSLLPNFKNSLSELEKTRLQFRFSTALWVFVTWRPSPSLDVIRITFRTYVKNRTVSLQNKIMYQRYFAPVKVIKAVSHFWNRIKHKANHPNRKTHQDRFCHPLCWRKPLAISDSIQKSVE